LKIHANQLADHLQKPVLPCYLVSGDEPLLVQEALDAIRKAAREQGFTERDLHVTGPGFDWRQMQGGSANMSLFAERRIFELRLATAKPGKDGGAAIIDLIGNAGDDMLVLLVAPKIDKTTMSSAWVKAVDARGGLIQVWPVEQRELPGWIAGRMRARGLDPDQDAVRMIADRIEGNLLAAQQEIEKLHLLLGKDAERVKVTAEHVSRAVVNSSRYDVYKLVDAAVSGNPRRALTILGGLRNEGVEPVIVAWALTRELRMLAGLADSLQAGAEPGTAMRKCGVWSNRQGIVRACVGRHSVTGLQKLLQAAGRTDAAAKGQMPGDPWQLAMDTVLGLADPTMCAA
jgi:DNA polymerase-3 subunit delta